MIDYPDNFFKSVASDFDGVFEWGYLAGAFPRGIMPMDWDGVVEINNNFLVFETKDVGKEVPGGQLMALKRATKVGPFIVVILWGKKEPVEYQLIYKGELREKKSCDKERIKRLCQAWVKWAEK